MATGLHAELLLAEATPASHWPGLVAQLWPGAPDRPTCLAAPLIGDALLLGRFGVGAGNARRATGGPTLRAGDGCLGFALALPRTGALLADGNDVPASKIVNRFVRPVLGALASLGVSAGYFGRDFISAQGRAVASVGWDAQRAGPALLECVVAFSRPLVDANPWGTVAHAPLSAERLLAMLRQGFRERLAVELADPRPARPPVEPGWPGAEERLPAASASCEIAIGRFEARVDALSAQGGVPRIARAALRGDFQADAETLLHLEQSLAGCPAVFAEVGARFDAAFGPRGRGTIVGVKSLAPLAQAVVQAAGAQIG